MYRISVSQPIESAHFTTDPSSPRDPRASVHGHSYVCTAWFASDALDAHGRVADLDQLRAALCEACAPLDHKILNDVDALPFPTMETICRFVWDRLAPVSPSLARVDLARPTLGYRASYAPAAK